MILVLACKSDQHDFWRAFCKKSKKKLYSCRIEWDLTTWSRFTVSWTVSNLNGERRNNFTVQKSVFYYFRLNSVAFKNKNKQKPGFLLFIWKKDFKIFTAFFSRQKVVKLFLSIKKKTIILPTFQIILFELFISNKKLFFSSFMWYSI